MIYIGTIYAIMNTDGLMEGNDEENGPISE